MTNGRAGHVLGIHQAIACTPLNIRLITIQMCRAHKESVVEHLGNPASVNPKLEEVPRPMEESSGGYAATIMGAAQPKADPDEPQKPVSACLLLFMF